jgi:hypothetical protein
VRVGGTHVPYEMLYVTLLNPLAAHRSLDRDMLGFIILFVPCGSLLKTCIEPFVQ